MNEKQPQVDYDAPIEQVREDILERSHLARQIHDLAFGTPLQLSVRIGVHGPWGQGKTSVLKLAEDLAARDGNVCIWFNPVTTLRSDDLWQGLVLEIYSQLAQREVELTSTKLRRGVSTVLRSGRSLGRAIDKLEGSPQKLLSFSNSIVRAFVHNKESVVADIQSALPNKRIAVFIDDLDRADPAKLPDFLLRIRELFALPRFSFVLAFDETIVSTALAAYNAAWDDGNSFLDKIFDFRVHIPDAKKKAVRRLFEGQRQLLCDFVPLDEIQQVQDLLPTNPRKVKLLARHLNALHSQVMRHDASELEWLAILISQMIQIESNEVLNRLVELFLEENAYEWASLLSDDERMREQAEGRLAQVLEAAPESVDRTRLRELVMAWKHHSKYSLAVLDLYQVQIATKPHLITWREFGHLLAECGHDPDWQSVRSFAERHAVTQQVRNADVVRELLTTAIMYRGKCLEDAAEATYLDTHRGHIEEAARTLRVVELFFAPAARDFLPEGVSLVDSYLELVKQVEHWLHFTANEADQELRFAERETLKRILQTPGGLPHLETAEALASLPHSGLREEEEQALRKELVGLLNADLEAAIASRFKEAGGIVRLRRYEGGVALRQTLFDAESKFWMDGGAWQRMLAEARQDNHRSRENLLDFLGLLLKAADGGFGGQMAEGAQKLIAMPGLLRDVWAVVTEKPLQHRMLSHLKEVRQKLVGLGVIEADMPVPDWLGTDHGE